MGSWNRFKGGDELEYQGKQIFACNVKLPIGTYVYRFLIDAEDWETHNNAPKTARNGIEYNQIHINEHSDDEEEDEFADTTTGDANAAMETNTTLMMGADGKLTMGKKRRGRPSVELDLGQDFNQNDEEEEDDEIDAPDETDGNEADADVSGSDAKTSGNAKNDHHNKKHHKKKKSKRRRKKKKKKKKKKREEKKKKKKKKKKS